MSALPIHTPLARLAVILTSLLLTALGAQAQSSKSAATVDSAADRSQRQSDNVYRWIKMHAEPARKPEASKPETVRSRPKSETATPLATSGSNRVPEPEEAPAAVPSPTSNTTALVAPSVAAVDPNALLRDAPPAAGRAQAAPEPEREDTLTVLAQPQPDIPRDLRNTLSSGKVTLAFTVQPDGSVRDPSVVSSSHRRLNRPALEAVAQWKFAPIRTAQAAKVELEFDLQ